MDNYQAIATVEEKSEFMKAHTETPVQCDTCKNDIPTQDPRRIVAWVNPAGSGSHHTCMTCVEEAPKLLPTLDSKVTRKGKLIKVWKKKKSFS